LPCLAPFCSLKEINRLEQHFHLTTCPNFPDQLSPQNNFEGYKWMAIAEKTAMQCMQSQHCQWVLDDPPGHRKRLKDRLTKEELIKAESIASNWISGK